MSVVRKIFPLVALGLLLSGCDKSEPAATTASATPSPVLPSQEPAAVAAPAPVAKVDLPTVEDYEKKAQTEITAQNMGQELDTIEKELNR